MRDLGCCCDVRHLGLVDFGRHGSIAERVDTNQRVVGVYVYRVVHAAADARSAEVIERCFAESPQACSKVCCPRPPEEGEEEEGSSYG